tara:strand:+ start:6659 stop:6973 length:315 start_codon:yes stop_codon:yes gene_type:complete
VEKNAQSTIIVQDICKALDRASTSTEMYRIYKRIPGGSEYENLRLLVAEKWLEVCIGETIKDLANAPHKEKGKLKKLLLQLNDSGMMLKRFSALKIARGRRILH